MRTDRGRPCVSSLAVIERPGEIARQPRSVDRVLLEHEREIGIRDVEELHEVVLDLDVVVRTRETQPSRALDGAARRGVQLTDEGPQVARHESARGLGLMKDL